MAVNGHCITAEKGWPSTMAKLPPAIIQLVSGDMSGVACLHREWNIHWDRFPAATLDQSAGAQEQGQLSTQECLQLKIYRIRIKAKQR